MTMKRMFTMLVMTFSLMVCQAQVTNQSIEQKIDSLQTQLDKLQRDYDYLNCEYKLNRIIHELDIKKNELYSQINTLQIKCYNSSYDRGLYKHYKEFYDQSVDSYVSTREYVYATIDHISLKIEVCNFHEREIVILKTMIKSIEPRLNIVKKSLDGYNKFLNLYGELP